MSALVFGKDVELRSHTIDRYGHLAWSEAEPQEMHKKAIPL